MAETSKSQETKQNNSQANVGATVAAGMQAADDVAARTAEVAQQRGRAAGEALRQGAEATADVTRQGTQAGVEAMRRAGETANETMRRTTQVMADGQRRIAHDTAETFEAVSHKVAQAAQGTSEEMRRLMTLPHAAEGGLHDMRQGIAGLVEGVVQTNLRATQELFRLTNPVAVVELQQRFMREYLDTWMQGTTTLLRAVRRTADETLRPLEQHAGQRQHAQQDHRPAAE